MELVSGQKQAAPSGRTKRIAVVYVAGEIREGKSADDLLMGGAAGAETVMKAIRDAAADDQVAAIVLRIDSPGGSALASDLIWREAQRTEKPVVASLSDIAASGGYYIAVAADRIVAAPGTLTGSIGVVGGKVAVGDAWGGWACTPTWSAGARTPAGFRCRLRSPTTSEPPSWRR